MLWWYDAIHDGASAISWIVSNWFSTFFWYLPSQLPAEQMWKIISVIILIWTILALVSYFTWWSNKEND